MHPRARVPHQQRLHSATQQDDGIRRRTVRRGLWRIRPLESTHQGRGHHRQRAGPNQAQTQPSHQDTEPAYAPNQGQADEAEQQPE